MNDSEVSLKNQRPAGKFGGLFVTIFLILFATPFAGFGLFALIQGIRKITAGDANNGMLPLLFGVIFSSIGFGLLFAAIWARKRAKQTAELQARFADRPWMMRADWAAGRIKSSAMAQSFLWFILALALCGIGGIPAFVSLPAELHKNNYPALLILIFPAIGIAFLVAAIRAWRSQLRFGDCFLELAEIPAHLGGALSGMIQTGARLKPEHGLHLKLSCIRRVVSGSGKNRNTTESILWQDEKVCKPEAALPEAAPGRSGIPVYFKLPADQPQCFHRGDVSVCWRLEARAKMAGPGFAAAFDVPVFQVGGAVAQAVNEPEATATPAEGSPDVPAGVAGAANEPDPTAALQMPIEELRRDEHSRIQVAEGPDGREFYFPAARNIVTVLYFTGFFLAWSGVVWFLFHQHAPWFLCVVFGLFDIVMACICFNLWFHSSRVTINPTRVRVTQRRLIFSRTREFDPGDIVRIDTQPGMRSGNRVYQNIKLVTRDAAYMTALNNAPSQPASARPPRKILLIDPTGITVASGISSAPEANWLAREMNRALGRSV